MKTKFFTLILLMPFCLLVKAQSPIQEFNQAKEQYDNNNFQACISILQNIESNYGPSPKETSLLTYAYYDSGDYINAQIALHKYLKLVPYSSSEAHQSLLDLGKDLDQKIEDLDQSFKAKVQKERMQAADQAISSVYNTPEKRAAQEYFNQQQEKVKQKQTEEEAFQNVVFENSVEASQNFYNDYPNSFHKSEVIDIWQKAFLRQASNLQDEEALPSLIQFKQIFPNALHYNEAKELYNQKWSDALKKYQEYLASTLKTKHDANKRKIGNVFLLTGIGFLTGAALYYGYPDETNQNTILYGGGAGFLLSKIVISTPTRNLVKKCNQSIKVYKEKIKYYSQSPVY